MYSEMITDPKGRCPSLITMPLALPVTLLSVVQIGSSYPCTALQSTVNLPISPSFGESEGPGPPTSLLLRGGGTMLTTVLLNICTPTKSVFPEYCIRIRSIEDKIWGTITNTVHNCCSVHQLQPGQLTNFICKNKTQLCQVYVTKSCSLRNLSMG